MLAAAENLSVNSITASAAANSEIEADAELFTKELNARLGSLNPTTQEKISQGLEKLAGALPGLSVSSRAGLDNFSGTASYFVRTGDNATVSMSPDIIAQIADDDSLLQSLQTIINNMFEAGKSQTLVNAGGDKVTRNLVVDAEAVRYVEVQRSRGGTTLSVANLALQTQKLMADAIEQMLSGLTGSRGSPRGPSQQSLFDLMFGGSQTRANRSQGNSGLLNNLVSQTDSWRFQFTAFGSSQLFTQLTGSGGAAAQTAGKNTENGQTAQDTAQVRTSVVTTEVKVALQQYASSGAAAAGMDLVSYMQMMGLCDPLVFDLADEGINLTSPEDGVYFDIKGDGSPVRTSFIQGNNAFLFLDQNGNGAADDANELFGDHGGFANGFAKLAQYDDNADGVIDENDAVYDQLRLWRDLNGDGVSQLEEAMSLSDAGIKSINLRHDNTRELDANGNVIGEKSSFTRHDGSRGLVADAWLRYLK